MKNALESSKAPYADKSFDVLLQGHYGNDTNIFSDSDVDTVIRLDSIFRSDLRQLSAEQQAAYRDAFEDATYSFQRVQERRAYASKERFRRGRRHAGVRSDSTLRKTGRAGMLMSWCAISIAGIYASGAKLIGVCPRHNNSGNLNWRCD